MAGLGQGSNACSVLNSYHAGCKYHLVEESGQPHSKIFVFRVEVLGVSYTGRGSSKKRAKQAAAAAALKSVYNINLSLGMEELVSPVQTASAGVCLDTILILPVKHYQLQVIPQALVMVLIKKILAHLQLRRLNPLQQDLARLSRTFIQLAN